jgi:hypothetical protein
MLEQTLLNLHTGYVKMHVLHLQRLKLNHDKKKSGDGI